MKPYLLLFLFIVVTSHLRAQDSTAVKTDSAHVAIVPKKDTVPYAIFYFYRAFIPKFNAPLKKVPIYINDSLVYELKANQYITYLVNKPGNYRFAIDKNGDSEFAVKVKMGQAYYFKCAIEKGLWFGKPAMEAISEKEGRLEIGLDKPK